MTLNKQQAALLRRMDRDDALPLKPNELQQVPGFHYCPDWDYLPICDDSPEKDVCTCKFHQ